MHQRINSLRILYAVRLRRRRLSFYFFLPLLFFLRLFLSLLFSVCVCVCGFECVSFLFQKMDGYRLFLVYNRRTERALSREFWIKTNRSFSLSRSLSLSVFSFTDRIIYLHLANRHPIQNARSQSTIYAKQKKKKKKRREEKEWDSSSETCVVLRKVRYWWWWCKKVNTGNGGGGVEPTIYR